MGSKLIVDENIPGFTPLAKLEVLAEHAKQVPENGWIVEAGSFCGRSAYVLAKNCHSSVTVTCIDIWPWIDGARVLDGNYNALGDKTQFYSYENFIRNTAECPNVEAIKERSPFFHPRFTTQQPDFVFIDADHSKRAVDKDLNFYYNMLSKNGVIIVDDYKHPKYPGVIQAVTEFVSKNNVKMQVLENTGKTCQFVKITRK